MTEATKHTPGPWREGQDGNLRVYGPDGMGEHSGLIAVVHKGRANVRLIAAAPEMKQAIVEADGCFDAALFEGWLQALEVGDIDRIRDLWERRISHARNRLQDAIAKAEGR